MSTIVDEYNYSQVATVSTFYHSDFLLTKDCWPAEDFQIHFKVSSKWGCSHQLFIDIYLYPLTVDTETGSQNVSWMEYYNTLRCMYTF